MELIWLLFLNTLSFNFVPTTRKSLRLFIRFIKSYINFSAVVRTNYCQSFTAFFLDVHYSNWPRSFFAAICPQWYYICDVEHTSCSNVVNSKVCRQMKRCEIVMNIINLTVGVKNSIGYRTTFSPNLHSVEEETSEYLPILQHEYHDFPTSYLKQAALDSWDNIYFGLPYLSQE